MMMMRIEISEKLWAELTYDNPSTLKYLK